MTHSTHLSGPIDVLYVPATQCVHVPPSEPVEPMLHTHTVLATGEFEFAVHFSHKVLSIDEYDPASQSLQVTAPTVVEILPAAQTIHTALSAAFLYVPATQSKHVLLPSVTVYLPATQSEHVEDPIYMRFDIIKCPSNAIGVPLQGQSRVTDGLEIPQSGIYRLPKSDSI